MSSHQTRHTTALVSTLLFLFPPFAFVSPFVIKKRQISLFNLQRQGQRNSMKKNKGKPKYVSKSIQGLH